ncbi:TetR/AcrR family transcriptional regulator [Algiphilus sp. W345]|uniref:TetR/AcrR family transcriptional regulator n=1 Tax=Banduia mediterranea TaxID=3075609 RepID=A0ABU2WF36_9GAMM|nr:TetR/AcrR family transcriptional regulator [Algiphilus sp. W345]MDT0496135.1 TetR/AcrR family transcriptional regulator [Algiphilus sp. W345]
MLKAAAGLFKRQGYAATTLRQIADDAGIQAGSVYYHFESKDRILAEILDVGIDLVHMAVLERLNALPADATGRERFAAAVEGHLTGLLQHEEYTSAAIRVYGQLPAGLRRPNQNRRRKYSALWDQLLIEADERGEIRPRADLHLTRLIVLGAINWTVEWFDPDQGALSATVDQMVSILSDGVFKPAEQTKGRTTRKPKAAKSAAV